MRVVIDMQGAQTESRFRGIGRYTMGLALGLARNAGEHEILLAVNGSLGESADAIEQAFKEYLPSDHIKKWYAPMPCTVLSEEGKSNRPVASKIHTEFLRSLNPDIVLYCSLMGDIFSNAVFAEGLAPHTHLITVLYDFIPLETQGKEWGGTESWYYKFYLEYINRLSEFSLLLCISEYTAQQARNYFDKNHIVAIGTDTDAMFRMIPMTELQKTAFLSRFGITKSFILYSGGSDARKNIVELLEAYQLLPENIRTAYDLVILEGRDKTQYAERYTQDNHIHFIGHLKSEDLITFYNSCELFVFPSLEEGFGLTVLEAMRCGAPVIASNATSLPEVVGLDDALFDPRDPQSLKAKLLQVLENPTFKEKLRSHGMQQQAKFSWDKIAQHTLHVMEALPVHHAQKPRMAFFSPLPPDQSGIAKYSAELLPALAEHYDIKCILPEITDEHRTQNPTLSLHDVNWFREHSNEMDRILYQLGNSPFHTHMFDLMREYKGVSVLHDFFLHNEYRWRELVNNEPGIFQKELLHSHGYKALKEYLANPVVRYPVSSFVFEEALGVIAHSNTNIHFADIWYGHDFTKIATRIPLVKTISKLLQKKEARQRLGIPQDAFLLCSFGILDSSKNNHRLIQAWNKSALAKKQNTKLIFVGQLSNIEYEQELLKLRHELSSEEQISITGWVSDEEFNLYLAAADMSVQLRAFSQGETSAAVMDCIAHSLPTIVNANGSFAEIPEDCVMMLPDSFTNEELVSALDTLYLDETRRKILGEKAYQYIKKYHSPVYCADSYQKFIEESYARYESRQNITKSFNLTDKKISHYIDLTFKKHPRRRQLFIDISSENAQNKILPILDELIDCIPRDYVVRPVYRGKGGQYMHACSLLKDYLHLELPDEQVVFHIKDTLVLFPWDSGINRSLLPAGVGLCVLTSLQATRNSLISAIKTFADQAVTMPDVPLTVLFHTWPAAFDCPGGGEIQLLEYEKYLSRMGVRVLRYDPWHPQFEEADIVHHFSSQPEQLFCEYSSLNKELPLVISSILWPDQKNKYDFPQIGGLYSCASRILPNSHVEGEVLSALLSIPEKYFVPIVNGVDECFFKKVSPDLFRTTYGITGPFVLCIGNIETRKNQLNLIRALRGTGIQLVLAGQEREPDYAVQCREAADDNMHFIGWLEHASELQRSAYAAAEALVLPSFLETPGLVALEAAAAGIPRLVITNAGCTKEYFGNLATYLTPDEPHSILKAVQSALSIPAGPCALRSHIADHFTWKRATEQLLKVYQQILRNGNTPLREAKASILRQQPLGLHEMMLPRNLPDLHDFVHLPGEASETFQSPEVLLPAGSYTANLTYSFLGPVIPPRAVLHDTQRGAIASTELKQGIRQTLQLPFTTEETLNHFSFYIEAPKNSTLIIVNYSLTLNHPSCLRLSSDLVTYGLTKYQRISDYDTLLPLDTFILNGEKINNTHDLVVYSEQETVISGPYVKLPPATYTALLPYSMPESQHDTGDSDPVQCAIRIEHGKKTLTSTTLLPGLKKISMLQFTLETPTDGLEITTLIPKNQMIKLEAPHLFIHPEKAEDQTTDNALVLSPFSTQHIRMLSHSGWHTDDVSGVWNASDESSFCITAVPGNYILGLTLSPCLCGGLKQRTVHCLVNGQELKHIVLNYTETVSLFIDKKIFSDKPVLEIVLKTDEPLLSPKQCGESEDPRVLGFFVSEMNLKLEPCAETGWESNPFNPDDAHIISKQGWHVNEVWGTWTSASSASFAIRTEPINGILSLKMNPYLGGGLKERTVHCLVNGQELKSVILSSIETISLPIDREIFSDKPELEICLKTDEPVVSPAQCGESGDPRVLGIGLRSVSLHTL